MISSLLLALLTTLATVADAPPVVVRLLDGTSTAGSLQSASVEAIELVAGDAVTKVAADKIQKVEFGDGGVDPIPSATTIQLRDGSTLQVMSVVSKGKNIEAILGDQGSISFPLSEVSWIQFRTAVGEIRKQWEEILADDKDGDRLVIQRSGEALDQVQGVVLSISETSVEFDFDGEKISAPREKLLGLRLFSTSRKTYPPPKVIVTDDDQSKFYCSNLTTASRGNGGMSLQLETPSGIKHDFGWVRAKSLDFSAGNLKLCAELATLERKWSGREEYAGNKSVAEKIMLPRTASFNVEAGSNDEQTPSLPIDLLFVAPGEITFRVPENLKRFNSTIRGSEGAVVQGEMIVSVAIEGKVLWQQTIRNGSGDVPVEVNVEPLRRVTLSVKPANNRQTDDSIWWIQPRFVR